MRAVFERMVAEVNLGNVGAVDLNARRQIDSFLNFGHMFGGGTSRNPLRDPRGSRYLDRRIYPRINSLILVTPRKATDIMDMLHVFRQVAVLPDEWKTKSAIRNLTNAETVSQTSQPSREHCARWSRATSWMQVKPFSLDVDEKPRRRFCVLEYSPSRGAEGLSPTGQAVLLLLEQPTGFLVLVVPDWKSRILPPDHRYFEEIMADFAHRAKSDPLSLLQQASEVNVGTLITRETGYVDMNKADIAELIQRFIPI